MDKIIFDKDDKVGLKDYINEKLQEGYSLTKLEKEIGISRKTISNRCASIQYRYDREVNQYIYDESMDNKKKTSVRQVKSIENTNNIKGDKCQTDVVQLDNDIKNKMLMIVNKYDKLIEIIDWFDNKEDKCLTSPTEIIEIKTGLQIDFIKSETKKVSIRTDADVWDKFISFTKEHPEFTKGDLLAQAINEFLNKWQC